MPIDYLQYSINNKRDFNDHDRSRSFNYNKSNFNVLIDKLNFWEDRKPLQRSIEFFEVGNQFRVVAATGKKPSTWIGSKTNLALNLVTIIQMNLAICSDVSNRKFLVTKRYCFISINILQRWIDTQIKMGFWPRLRVHWRASHELDHFMHIN